MKRLKLLILLLGILVIGCGFNAVGQNRPEKTSSAKAYYGEKPGKPKLTKKKKQKVNWAIHTKPAKGTRGDAWSTRRKYVNS